MCDCTMFDSAQKTANVCRNITKGFNNYVHSWIYAIVKGCGLVAWYVWLQNVWFPTKKPQMFIGIFYGREKIL